MIKNSTPVSNNKHPWPRVYGLSEHAEWITFFPRDVVPLGQGSGEGEKCYGVVLIYSWGPGLNGSVGSWRCLSALGAWEQTYLTEAEQACLVGRPRGLAPALGTVPCPVRRVGPQHRTLSPSQADCSHMQPSTCSSETSKPPCEAAEHCVRKSLGRRTWDHFPRLNRANLWLP